MAFRKGQNISRYFILCTVALDPASITNEVMTLRRELAWEGRRDDACIHATSDPQDVRDQVFALLQNHDFRVDATILEKAKAQPHVRETQERFYKYAWYFHLKHVGPKVFDGCDQAFVCAASIGTKKAKGIFRNTLNSVVDQTIPGLEWRTSFWEAKSDPCLLVADYCCWAIQRKWESGDDRSYVLIQDEIATEFDLWRSGTTTYY